MKHKKFFGAASAALITVIVITLVLAPAAGAASKYKVLHRFHGGANDGSEPLVGLILDAAGNLYGTTFGGGAFGYGAAFKLTPNADGSWTESVLHSFTSSDGSYPYAGLIFDAAGNLYGTTEFGGGGGYGTVFKLTPNADGSWTESVLHWFHGRDGSYPRAGLTFDAAGNLYGTTSGGGAFGYGAAFKLTPNADGSWTERVLHSFNGSDGAYPYAGLTFDAAGNLYGTTSEGGASGNGTVFKLTPNADGSWTESVLHSFSSSDGAYPWAGAHLRRSGKSLRHDPHRRPPGGGTVFKLAPNQDGSWTESVLHSFSRQRRMGTLAGLIFDAAREISTARPRAAVPRVMARLSSCHPIWMEAGRTV